MSNQITINEQVLRKTQIDVYENIISVFLNDNIDFQFNLSLQPTGKDDELPTYQLTEKSQTIPSWTKENLNIISDWLTKEAN